MKNWIHLSIALALLALSSPAQTIAPVNLTWQDNSDNENGFFIYRSVDGTNFFALDTTGVDAAAYQDAALMPGETYWWHVTAFNDAGESLPSNTVSLTMPEPLPPLPIAPSLAAAALPPRPGYLVNASVRVKRTADEGTPIAGFVISGDTAIAVLLRAVGPGLDRLNVPNTLPNPRLALFRGQTQIATNDDWDSTDSALSQAMGAVHAFALTPGSTDAAMLITLDPGQYTVHAQVSPGTPDTGVVLIEAYEVPPQP